MLYQILTEVRKVSFVKKMYYYKSTAALLKKYPKTGMDKYGYNKCVITDELLEDKKAKLLEIHEYIINCHHSSLYDTKFTYTITRSGEIISEGELPNFHHMLDDALFQEMLVFENEYFTFDEMKEIQSALVMRYNINSTTVNYELKGTNENDN